MKIFARFGLFEVTGAAVAAIVARAPVLLAEIAPGLLEQISPATPASCAELRRND